MRRSIIVMLCASALVTLTVACGSGSRLQESGTTDSSSATNSSATHRWTHADTADAPQAATAEFCCSQAIPDSPEFSTDAQALADGLYAMHIANWFADVKAAVIDMSILRYRSCADPFMVSSDLNDCTGVVDDLASAADLSLETHRVLDLSRAATSIWVLGHSCRSGTVEITSWTGDGTAFVNLMHTFQTDKSRWIDPYVEGDQFWVQDLPPQALTNDSPFTKSSCVENALEWTFPSGPTLLIQGSLVGSGPNAEITQFLSGRAFEVAGDNETAYFYGGYRP